MGFSLALLRSSYKEGISSIIYSISCHVGPKMASFLLQNCPVLSLWLVIQILFLKEELLNGSLFWACCFLWFGKGRAFETDDLRTCIENLGSVSLWSSLRVVSEGVGTAANWKGLSEPVGKSLTSVRACSWYTGSLVRYLNWVRWSNVVAECWCSLEKKKKCGHGWFPLTLFLLSWQENLRELDKYVHRGDEHLDIWKVKQRCAKNAAAGQRSLTEFILEPDYY